MNPSSMPEEEGATLLQTVFTSDAELSEPDDGREDGEKDTFISSSSHQAQQMPSSYRLDDSLRELDESLRQLREGNRTLDQDIRHVSELHRKTKQTFPSSSSSSSPSPRRRGMSPSRERQRSTKKHEQMMSPFFKGEVGHLSRSRAGSEDSHLWYEGILPPSLPSISSFPSPEWRGNSSIVHGAEGDDVLRTIHSLKEESKKLKEEQKRIFTSNQSLLSSFRAQMKTSGEDGDEEKPPSKESSSSSSSNRQEIRRAKTSYFEDESKDLDGGLIKEEPPPETRMIESMGKLYRETVKKLREEAAELARKLEESKKREGTLKIQFELKEKERQELEKDKHDGERRLEDAEEELKGERDLQEKSRQENHQLRRTVKALKIECQQLKQALKISIESTEKAEKIARAERKKSKDDKEKSHNLQQRAETLRQSVENSTMALIQKEEKIKYLTAELDNAKQLVSEKIGQIKEAHDLLREYEEKNKGLQGSLERLRAQNNALRTEVAKGKTRDELLAFHLQQLQDEANDLARKYSEESVQRKQAESLLQESSAQSAELELRIQQLEAVIEDQRKSKKHYQEGADRVRKLEREMKESRRLALRQARDLRVAKEETERSSESLAEARRMIEKLQKMLKEKDKKEAKSRRPEVLPLSGDQYERYADNKLLRQRLLDKQKDYSKLREENMLLAEKLKAIELRHVEALRAKDLEVKYVWQRYEALVNQSEGPRSSTRIYVK